MDLVSYVRKLTIAALLTFSFLWYNNTMKKIIPFAIVGVLLLAGAGYYLFGLEKPFAPPKGTVLLRISKETTIVTEPLLPEGNAVDFDAVLDQFSATNADSEENGFRDIVRLLGRNIFGSISDEKWTILCTKLKLNPDDPPLLHFVKRPDYFCDALEKAEGKEPQFDTDGKRLFDNSIKNKGYIYFSFDKPEEISAEHRELLERWIMEMEPAISATAEALKKLLYVMPQTGEYELEQFVFTDLPSSATRTPDFITCTRSRHFVLPSGIYRQQTRRRQSMQHRI